VSQLRPDILGIHRGHAGWHHLTSLLLHVANSLLAIKKLVYDEKKITMSELLDALEKNFEGYELLREELLKAPKFGKRL
jgi:hypothetical protein